MFDVATAPSSTAIGVWMQRLASAGEDSDADAETCARIFCALLPRLCATATTAMTHIAIQEALDGKAVDWMEKVTDEQYQPRSRPNERR